MKTRKITRRKFLKNSSALACLPALNAPTLAIAETISQKTANDLISKYPYSYNGESLDSLINAYHLGQGYRFYSPELMRFSQSDLVSPFNKGGINPYMYCHGDPINFVDPTGFAVDVAGIVSNVLGIIFNIIVIGLIAVTTPFTGGMSLGALLPAVSGLLASVFGIVSSTLAIASSSLDSESPAKKKLSDASTGFGIIASVFATLSLGSGAKSSFRTFNRGILKFNHKTGKSKLYLPKDTSKTNGRLPFVRKAVGTAFEGASTAAGISSFVLSETGNTEAAQQVAYARVGLNVLAVFAYAPIGIYTRGLNTGNRKELFVDVMNVTKEVTRTAINLTFANNTFSTL